MRSDIQVGIILISIVFGLSACGGGGGGSDPVSPPPPPPPTADTNLDWDNGNWDEGDWQ
jgi:hypothetical protein